MVIGEKVSLRQSKRRLLAREGSLGAGSVGS